MIDWETPERRALRALARDVVAREVAPHVDRWETDGELPRSLHRTFADAGLLAPSFPEEMGGGWEVMKMLKRNLDPHNIMNPGKQMLDESYED